MYPKCGVDHCGSRSFRLIGSIRETPKTPVYFYQCSAGHVIMTREEIKDEKNPLSQVVTNENK